MILIIWQWLYSAYIVTSTDLKQHNAVVELLFKIQVLKNKKCYTIYCNLVQNPWNNENGNGNKNLNVNVDNTLIYIY